jgi:hypothetical protein
MKASSPPCAVRRSFSSGGELALRQRRARRRLCIVRAGVAIELFDHAGHAPQAPHAPGKTHLDDSSKPSSPVSS